MVFHFLFFDTAAKASQQRLLTSTALALVSLSLALSDSNFSQPAYAKAARRAAGGGGGGGGVMLKSPNPTNPIEHNNRAVELGSLGLWADAIREHEIALEGDPYREDFKQNLSGACLRYGDSLASKKKYYEAMVQYRKALVADPANAVADRNLDECLKATGKNPDDAKVRHSIAETAETEGRFKTAQVEYRKVTRMTDDGASHADLARSLRKDGQDVPAFEEMKIAINKPWKDKNEQAACHSQLGDVLWQYAKSARDRGDKVVGMKRLQNAAVCYRRAVTLNPAYSDAIQGLKEVAREAVSINPSFDNHLMLAGAYQLAGDFEHAKMEYEECWKKNPTSPALAKARRSFHMSVVTNPATPPAVLAATLLKVEDSLKNNNDDPEMLYIYGRGKEAQGDKDTAMRAYRAAAAKNPLVVPDLAQGISRLGCGPAPTIAGGAPGAVPTGAGSAGVGMPAGAPVVPPAPAVKTLSPTRFAAIEGKIRSNDTDGALKDLMEATDKDPSDGKAWLLLGRTHEKKGDLDQASACYRQAMNLKDSEAKDALRQVDTSRIQPLKTEAEKQEASGNFVGAASSWKDAATIAPSLILPHKKLAEMLIKMGDQKEADKELKKVKDLEKE